MEKDIPRLRTDIEIIPTYYQEERALLVKDSLGLIKESILLKGEVLDIISLINGERNIRDIQLELIRLKGGVFMSSEAICEILSELDSAFLMDSEHYRQEKNKIIEEYSSLRVRKACLAGHSYPEAPEQLKAYLDSFFCPEKEASSGLGDKEIRALVAPHIDLNIGKKIYSKAYQVLKNSFPKKIVLLGTGHSLQGAFISMSEKDFETPLGRVKTDKKWVRKLKEAGKKIVLPSDIAHRSEHSLEFQLLFLQYLFGSEFSIIPILCGPFHQVLNKASRPSGIQGMNDFLNVLRLCVEEQAKDTLIVVGVDFSHIGPKFGHREKASFLLFEAKEHDKILLDAICNGNLESFWAESRKANNKYNVCGFSALACLLELLSGKKGHLLGYDFWQEEPTQSAVSFAAIAFEAN